MKKVTAKHLMIGDWVKWKGEYRQVKVLSTYLDKTSNMYFKDTNVGSPTATPIPITEEWLKLNGAKNIDGAFVMYVTECFMITYSFEMGLRIYKYNKMISWTLEVAYIHQLQQAYRLATGGKELKIKF